MDVFSTTQAFKKCLIFGNLPPDDTKELVQTATPVVFPEGTLIFTEKDRADYVYVIGDDHSRHEQAEKKRGS